MLRMRSASLKIWFFDTPGTPGDGSIVERKIFESKQPLCLSNNFQFGLYISSLLNANFRRKIYENSNITLKSANGNIGVFWISIFCYIGFFLYDTIKVIIHKLCFVLKSLDWALYFFMGNNLFLNLKNLAVSAIKSCKVWKT